MWYPKFFHRFKLEESYYLRRVTPNLELLLENNHTFFILGKTCLRVLYIQYRRVPLLRVR